MELIELYASDLASLGLAVQTAGNILGFNIMPCRWNQRDNTACLRY